MSKFEITDELMNERIELYMNKHQDEIIADIDMRVDKMVKKVVREMFTGRQYKKSTMETLLIDKIETVTKTVIDELEIDKQNITDILNRQIARRVKNIDIDITL